MARLVVFVGVLVPLLAVAQPPGDGGRSEPDSLVSRIIDRVQFDRYLDAAWTAESLPIPDGIAGAAQIRRRWDDLVTAGWRRRQLRRHWVEVATVDELRAVLEWLDDPIVVAAIRHDLSGASRNLLTEIERLEADGGMGSLDPTTREAVIQITRVARVTERSARQYGSMEAEFYLFQMALPTDRHQEARAQMAAVIEAALPTVTSEPDPMSELAVAASFVGFPADGLRHYAHALAQPAGQAYLRLSLDATSGMYLDAIRLVLDKTRK